VAGSSEDDPCQSTDLTATHEIKRGEEITNCYSYNFTFKSRAQRQKWLRDNYRFTCACPACFNSDTDGRKNVLERDRRRRSCETLFDSLKEYFPPNGKQEITSSNDNDGEELLLPNMLAAKAAWYVNLLEEEGLQNDDLIQALVYPF
jgi:hypothetical protein